MCKILNLSFGEKKRVIFVFTHGNDREDINPRDYTKVRVIECK